MKHICLNIRSLLIIALMSTIADHSYLLIQLAPRPTIGHFAINRIFRAKLEQSKI